MIENILLAQLMVTSENFEEREKEHTTQCELALLEEEEEEDERGGEGGIRSSSSCA